jgi:myo-inositol-1(or 4)-monophosphatase
MGLQLSYANWQIFKEHDLLSVAIALAQEAGRSLMESFGRDEVVEKKGDHSNIVTAADVRAEQIIVRGIQQRFPAHSIIAEETGCDLRESEFTWVIDPLDGTSNYAAALPWFGVLICLLRDGLPFVGVSYLPALNALYHAQAGVGAFLNGKPIAVTEEQCLENVLWAYGMDGGSSQAEASNNVALLAKLLPKVRNIRATNCLLDAAFTADGRFGGMLNQSTRLWDIAAPMLIVQEAGGFYTDVQGCPLHLDISSSAADKVYAVLAGAPILHKSVVAIVNAASDY